MSVPQQSQPNDGLARLVAEVSGATGAPPEVVAAFLQYVAEQAGPSAPDVLRRVLRMPPEALTQMMVEFANSPAGAGVAQTGPQGAPPPGMAPQGPPPLDGQPPPGMMPPTPSSPPSSVQGPPNQMGGPSLSPKPKPAPKEKKVKRRADAAPPWEPDELPDARYTDGPDYATVIAHAEEGRRYYSDLTDALQTWRDIWHMVDDDKTKLDRTPTDDQTGEDIWHTRAQPTTMAKRIVGMTAPSLSRIGIQADPWDDTDECREAAQKCENYARHALETVAREWNRRATSGDMRGPFDRVLSGLATIEGGYGFRVMPNPKRKAFPWDVEPVPLMELMPRPLATTRQVECSLSEAYAYEQLRDLLPPPTPGATDPPYDGDSRVRLITWTDETHYCMAAEFAIPEIAKRAKERTGKDEYWIVEPKAHNLGRRIYLIPNPWDSDPLGPSSRDSRGRARYLSQGIYAPLVGTIAFVNKMVSAIGSDVFKQTLRPKKWKLDPTMRQASGGLLPSITQDMYNQAHIAGGNVVLGPNEDVEDIVNDIAATQAGQAFLQSLLGDLEYVSPPVLAGRGAAESGFDRFQASQAAGVLHVDPIIEYHVTSLQYLLEIILTDLVRLGDGEGRIFAKLPYRAYRGARGTTKRAGYMSTLTAKDVRRNGPYLTIKFKRDSLSEELQLTNLMLMQVKEHLRSRVSAMDELGIDDTERERMLMFTESALEAPDVVKAAIKAALKQSAAAEPENEDGSINEAALMLDAINEMEMRQQQQEQAKGMPGLPSPAGAPPGQAPLPGQSTPGLPPVMQGLG